MIRNIFVAGHNGMVGSALVRQLQDRCDSKIITKNREELDLRDQAAVLDLFKTERIEQVYLAAATVGGDSRKLDLPCGFPLRQLNDRMQCYS